MKMFKAFACAVVCLLTLTSCNSKGASGGYVDVSSVLDGLESNTSLDANYIDSRINHGIIADGTFDGVYFNDLNTLTGAFEINCSNPTCTHLDGNCKPIRYRGTTIRKDRCYFEEGNTGNICYFQLFDGEKVTAFKATDDNSKSVLTHFIDDDRVISCGYNNVKLINLSTGEIESFVGDISSVNEEKQEITEEDIYATAIFNMAVVNEHTVAVTNMNFELFCVDLQNKTSAKIADYAPSVQTDGKSLYYTSYKDNKLSLVKCDIDGSNSKEIVKDISPYYTVLSDCVVYVKQGDNTQEDATAKTVYKMSFSDMKEQVLYCCDDEQVGSVNYLYSFPGYEDKLFIKCQPDSEKVMTGSNPAGVIIYDFDDNSAKVYKNADFCIEPND